MSCTGAHWGTLRLKGFFLTFFWLRSRRGQKSHFFRFWDAFWNLKVNSGPFWVPKRGPGGYFLEVLGGSGEGRNFGLIFRRFFYKNGKHAKSQNIDFYCHAQCFVRVTGLEKARGPRQTCKFFFILFLSKIGPKSKKLARKTVIEVKVGRKSFRGPSLNVHFQARERF